jgi:hypothetical protein
MAGSIVAVATSLGRVLEGDPMASPDLKHAPEPPAAPGSKRRTSGTKAARSACRGRLREALAQRVLLWEGIWVNRIALACFGSAFAGSLLGAGMTAWMTHAGAPATPAVPAGDSHLAERLASVEQRLAIIEPRVRVLPGLVGAGAARVEPAAPSAPAAADAPHVDSPVFEAAVVDIIERTEDGRDDERAAARDAKRRQRSAYWANEVTMRLGLSPAQTERLMTIETKLQDDLDAQRSTTSDGQFIPREVRRDARIALRQRAEDQLRGVLEPRQLAAYESLDDKLKLYRPKGD